MLPLNQIHLAEKLNDLRSCNLKNIPDPILWFKKIDHFILEIKTKQNHVVNTDSIKSQILFAIPIEDESLHQNFINNYDSKDIIIIKQEFIDHYERFSEKKPLNE